MRSLIAGAGATGLAFGARLQAAGADVTYLVRPARKAALAASGAVLHVPGETVRLPAHAITADEVDGAYDLVVVAVKASALEQVIAQLHPAVGPETVIIPFLNGMRHIDLLNEAFPGQVVGGRVRIVSTLDAEGAVLQQTPLAEITIGPLDDGRDLTELAAQLNVPGFDVLVAESGSQILWEKWAFIVAAGIVACLFDNTVGNILKAGGRGFIEQAIAEAEAVVAAAGHPVRAFSTVQSRGILTEEGSEFTSSLYRDLLAGGPNEAEHILGDFAQRARTFGVDTPLLDAVLVRIRAASIAS